MADTKITGLAAGSALHSDDWLVYVDTHDTTMAVTGTDKKLSPATLLTGLGVIPVSQGGTALTSAGSSDQVLGVAHTGGGLEYKTIAAGSGVTVTPSAGTLTIAATGGGGSGTVTEVDTGTGLTGGPITGTGTIALGAVSNNTVLANISGGSTAPLPNTVTAIIDSAISSTQGVILYRGASTWSALSPGTSGQVLATQGASANPHWVDAAGGGTVTSVTFTGDGTVLSSTPSSAVTTSGTVTGTLLSQAKNTVLAGPASGSNAAPTFRALGTADLPVLTTNLIYSGRSGNAVSNVSGATSLLTGITNDIGSLTIPAGALNSVGRMLMIRAYGTYSSTSTAAPTFTVSLGGTTIATGAMGTMTAQTSKLFVIDFGYFSVRSTGASGAMQGFLHFYTVNAVGTGGNGVIFTTLSGNGAAPTSATLDFTGTLALDIKIAWGETSSTDSIQLQHLAVWTQG
jgi:hypothetical protein